MPAPREPEAGQVRTDRKLVQDPMVRIARSLEAISAHLANIEHLLSSCMQSDRLPGREESHRMLRILDVGD